MLSAEKISRYNGLCKRYRRELLNMLHAAQTGHPGGSLSAVEIVTLLYHEIMNVDPANPAKPDRDIFILGKGHAAPILYLVLADRGFIDRNVLTTFRQVGSCLQGHPSALKVPGIELSTGPLGLGLSAGVGRAAAAKLDKTPETIYVLSGDGEMQEGIVWEAAMAAAKFKLDNLVNIVDYNRVQLDGTLDEIMPMGDVRAKWEAFGWHCLEMNGHDPEDVHDRILEAKTAKNGKPVAIIAHTTKGRGVSFMEGKNTWHGKPITNDELAAALKELEDK